MYPRFFAFHRASMGPADAAKPSLSQSRPAVVYHDCGFVSLVHQEVAAGGFGNGLVMAHQQNDRSGFRRSANGLRRSLITALSILPFRSWADDTPSVKADAAALEENEKQILVVVGPSTHPPGTHEVAAGGRLVAHCMMHPLNAPPIRATVVDHWPDAQTQSKADSVVFIGDMFPPTKFANTESILDELSGMMDRGCGIVCLHYATGLEAKDVGPDGQHPLLQWMGGYFATRCDHRRSVARIFDAATIEKASADHPVGAGWEPFTLHDEPYINNYFGPEANRMLPGAIPLATSMLPPEAPERQVVAWGIDRTDGGRGFGIVMPHYYRNWANDPLRTLICNGIAWSTGADVPKDGFKTETPDLRQFDPDSIEPQARKKAKTR
ncbi:hypothetical protein [Crateriforma spongiae]|uniref:hypothetical protein n=1 Tax=Crateriforma spongiae TaxID=2724528 RepID=UPI001F3D3718|nr:hypothetical protein [Crateriforma spongiae]